jgi:hypothetical protein
VKRELGHEGDGVKKLCRRGLRKSERDEGEEKVRLKRVLKANEKELKVHKNENCLNMKVL